MRHPVVLPQPLVKGAVMSETHPTRLTYVGPGSRSGKAVYRCTCGVEKELWTGNVRSGDTRSCGCLLRETAAARQLKHGAARRHQQRIEWHAWNRMRQRCYNPRDRVYRHYGGRGIIVCARWLASFADFLSDVGPRPSPAHSLDRYPDNDGNYEPGNVRWATGKEQARNKRSNLMLTHAGRTQLLVVWAEEIGIPAAVIRERLSRYGWSVEKALTTPRTIRKTKGSR